MASSGSEHSVTGVVRVEKAEDGPSMPHRAEMVDEEERRRRIRDGKRAVRSGGRGGEETDGEGESRQRKRARVLDYFDVEAEVDDDEDEEDEEGEEEANFINEAVDLEYEPDQRVPRPAYIAGEDEMDVEEIERRVRERYSRPNHPPYVEDQNDVEQQALLPTLHDPKFFLVKCKIGHEREIAIRLMQRVVQRKDLRIFSVVALDHLQNYIYVEAKTFTDVKEALSGLQNIYFSHEPEVIPTEEMSSVLSVENKIVDVAEGSWVRMRRGDYQGDLAQVVDVDNGKQEVTVKLIPRIDLRHLAEKSASKVRNAIPKQNSTPPPRFFRKDEVRKYKNLRIFKKRDKKLGEGFVLLKAPSLPQMMFKGGFLYKTVSKKSISTSHIEPTFEELEKFKGPCRHDITENITNLSTTVTNRKSGHFMRGDAVVVICGDLKNLEGWVQKVEADSVHIRPKTTGLPETLAFKDSELCKFFKPGERVKVVAGVMEGASGTVVKVDGHVLTVLSDTTKKHISVFADHVIQSAEFTKPLAQIGGYELYDFVQLNDKSFGVITRLESEGFEVLHGMSDRPEVRMVSLREIRNKIYSKNNAMDRLNNIISAEDIVRVIEGPYKGKQGTIKYILNGMLFINDPCHREHAGFICTKAQSCLLVGGTTNGNIGVGHALDLRSGASSPSSSSESRRAPRGVASSQFSGWNFGGCDEKKGQENNLVGKYVKIKCGPYKGYNGQVVGFKGNTLRVELESLMKTINFCRDQITDASVTPATTHQDIRSLPSARTPIHPSRTPLHPMQTPMHDVGATPMHGGVRTGNRGLDSIISRRL